jgi:hypothetical protein
MSVRTFVRKMLPENQQNCVATKRTVYINLLRVMPFISSNNRETREGWPLLTVENEANGDSKSTNDRGPFLVGSLALGCQYQD